MIRAVFFDLDGTLYDRDAFVADLFAEQFEVFRTELETVGKEPFVHRMIELDDHGHGSKKEIYKRAIEEWRLDSTVADRLCEHFWSDYDGRYKVDPAVLRLRLPEDTRVTLESLKAHRKKIGVITNGGTVRQQHKIELLGISSILDAILISESEGVRKPETEIFRRALARCGVAAGEAIFVGDHPEADVAGAKRAGLVAVWKFVPYWTLTTENVPTVHNLQEVLPLCLDAEAGRPTKR